MAWKRQLHADKGTRLVELYHYQLMEGGLFDAIDAQLAALGVQYQELPRKRCSKHYENLAQSTALPYCWPIC
ncbi:hypothetical protein P4133_22100 [Pseudomonas aeruginosa]|nr:hypothetical protein [Pseudomonas aeruginosa]